jgi:hypothetical protein
MASPALDGTARVDFTNASTGTATLTTANPGDAIFALVVWGGNFTQGATTYGATSVASISSTHTTNWQKVASGNANGTGAPTSPATGATCYAELWQGLAAAALTGEGITVTMAGGVNANVDSGQLMVFGISSATAYTALAQDPNNLSLATALSYDSHAVSPPPGPNALATVNITTTNAADLLLEFFCNINNSVGQGIPAGFTTLSTHSNAAGNFWATITSGYEQVAAAQNNVAITTSNTIGFTEGWVYIVLAVQNGPGRVNPPPATFPIAVTTNVH